MTQRSGERDGASRGQSGRRQVLTRSVRPPTLEEVAALAGVGRGTVSRVVNGSAQVAETTRTAVLAAIDELGYVPNRAARALVTKKTETVALVIAEPGERFFGEPFFAAIVRGVSSALSDQARQLLLAMVQSTEDRHKLRHYLTPQHVDGVMLLSLHGDDPLPRRLEQRGLPTVVGGRPVGHQPPHWVDIDNVAGARLAVQHLIQRGCTTIATVAGPQDMGVGARRLLGYRTALADAGRPYDPDLVAYGDFSETSGFDATRALLQRRPETDGLFAASDLMAAGALRALKEAGRAVPQDVSLVGFEDAPFAGHTDPPLTTVNQPVEEMGRQMVNLLVALIEGRPEARSVVLAPHLVVRGSA